VKSVMTVLIIISVLLLLGALKYLLDLSKPGVYPPKQLLKKRAVTLAGGGVIFLVIGFIIGKF
jgi:hypothetical protein